MRLMKSPSTVNENGHSVIMPLDTIHTMPAKGSNPRMRERARIIERKLPPVFLRIFFLIFTPELVSGAMDEYILQRRLTYGDCLNLSRERLNQIGDEAMPVLLLDAHLICHHRGFDVEAQPNVFGQKGRVVRGVEQDDIAADFALQFRG